jgi:cellulose synthase/poly-beta-1,6-N-acetylglucosamine synthase-like glycosyltransferase
MISFYLVWVVCYFVLLSLLMQKWPKKQVATVVEQRRLTVTLLIPFRNERRNAQTLIEELQKIKVPDLEIILIDDQSEDDSFLFLAENLKHDGRVKVLRSPGIGKKAAVEFGVENSQGEVIVCSDADCIFPQDWIQELLVPFMQPEVQLVAGPVITRQGRTFFQRFQQIEWASILLLTQFFFEEKRPLMCSGANLAYRKSAFLQVGGFDQNRQFLSGDDEFMLKKIVAKYGASSCVYLPFASVLVRTVSQPDLFSLLNQRVRWAGKWKAHRDLTHSVSALFSFLIQVGWIMSFALLLLGWVGMLVFLLVWSGKILAEKRALGKVLANFEHNCSSIDFIKTGFLHPFYGCAVAFGSLRGNFSWKGRTN